MVSSQFHCHETTVGLLVLPLFPPNPFLLQSLLDSMLICLFSCFLPACLPAHLPASTPPSLQVPLSALRNANPQVAGDLIRVGQQLFIPAVVADESYEVETTAGGGGAGGGRGNGVGDAM